MATHSLIRVKNLVKTYRMGEIEVHALRGVTLDIEQGDFVAIMGASGSGKSTFMNILGCLDLPTSGEYYLDNENVLSFSKNTLAELRNKKLGFIFQSFNILPKSWSINPVLINVLLNQPISCKCFEVLKPDFNANAITQ